MARELFLVLPAWSDQAGRCQIVARIGPLQSSEALAHYQSSPGEWRVAGWMNSSGFVVALDGPSAVLQEMRECQPLMAGLVFSGEGPA